MKTILGVPITKIDTIKYIVQLRCIVLWLKNKCRGTLVAATGFGKSFVVLILIKRLNVKNPDKTSMIVVPTKQLKDQWLEHVQKFKLKRVSVFVINTIALKEKQYHVDLLVLDEVHLFASAQFRNVFSRVKYKWIFGLTATLERLDGKEEIIKKVAPVFKTITQKECVEKGWINDFIEINVPVYLRRHEHEALERLSKQIRYYISKFEDFEVMQKCMSIENAKAYAQIKFPYSNIEETAKTLVRDAVQGQRSIKARQEFLYTTEHKVEATVEIINTFGLKSITFSQSTDFADKVKEALGDKAVVYHSYIASETRMVKKKKTYKTSEGLRKFLASTPNAKREGSSLTAYWKVPKRFGPSSLKKEALAKFASNKSKVNVVCTAKALDQGFDAPDVEMGVIASRTSNPTQHTQRTGRIARNYTYKDGTKKQGIVINLFIPDTRDEDWLRKCQVNSANVLLTTGVRDCISILKKSLTNIL